MSADAQEVAAVTEDLRNKAVGALRLLVPDTGGYMSESDPTEPNWQNAFWGSNYPRLLRLKEVWDPKGVFWCNHCVGSELWTVQGGDGFGQGEGKICKNTNQ